MKDIEECNTGQKASIEDGMKKFLRDFENAAGENRKLHAGKTGGGYEKD